MGSAFLEQTPALERQRAPCSPNVSGWEPAQESIPLRTWDMIVAAAVVRAERKDRTRGLLARNNRARAAGPAQVYARAVRVSPLGDVCASEESPAPQLGTLRTVSQKLDLERMRRRVSSLGSSAGAAATASSALTRCSS
eukprot:CAMPEP_0168360752 /NCGR_PEP_ID=MMETSP0228-20121227/2319_1 /TAXON_ID=133427 /ORGANISM="Protoceratium reticulatum, Strain CCCM 535 (=CCMP 1889)" /LENGTH=138 /DNA_ID=CAMNT_0008373421 /DNA_START=284 /DNA_END=697 /DNA_ORIENTATION=-